MPVAVPPGSGTSDAVSVPCAVKRMGPPLTVMFIVYVPIMQLATPHWVESLH